jgi:hypothetical protein
MLFHWLFPSPEYFLLAAAGLCVLFGLIGGFTDSRASADDALLPNEKNESAHKTCWLRNEEHYRKWHAHQVREQHVRPISIEPESRNRSGMALCSASTRAKPFQIAKAARNPGVTGVGSTLRFSATVHAVKGNPFAAFQSVKVVWAPEFKDGAFSIASSTAG